MNAHQLSRTADSIRASLDFGEPIECTLELFPEDELGRLGLIFVPLDSARVSVTDGGRAWPELGQAVDWTLVCVARTGRCEPFRLSHRDEHELIGWPDVAEPLNLASSDAKIVAALLCDIARVPHGIENLGEILAGETVLA